ncbi:MAG: chemotaxis protein CheD [Firmicutes bacterium]|nr:chemotaxis protein CheD [Bacillota bacterium]
MEELFVNMGQIRSLKSTGVLTTVGLGSCVGVTLYDSVAKVGVMGHIFLPTSRGSNGSTITSPGKYADTGIPALIEQAVKLGAQKRRLVAKIAGGANLFPNLNLNSVSIGEQNIAAVIKNLSNHNIPIVGKDVAGNHGRKMRFFVETGRVCVTAIGKEPIEI